MTTGLWRWTRTVPLRHKSSFLSQDADLNYRRLYVCCCNKSTNSKPKGGDDKLDWNVWKYANMHGVTVQNSLTSTRTATNNLYLANCNLFLQRWSFSMCNFLSPPIPKVHPYRYPNKSPANHKPWGRNRLGNICHWGGCPIVWDWFLRLRRVARGVTLRRGCEPWRHLSWRRLRLRQWQLNYAPRRRQIQTDRQFG